MWGKGVSFEICFFASLLGPTPPICLNLPSALYIPPPLRFSFPRSPAPPPAAPSYPPPLSFFSFNPPPGAASQAMCSQCLPANTHPLSLAASGCLNLLSSCAYAFPLQPCRKLDLALASFRVFGLRRSSERQLPAAAGCCRHLAILALAMACLSRFACRSLLPSDRLDPH